MTDNKYGEILIIEDDKDINDLLATALSKAGYRTRQAWSGTEGELLLKLDREAYALVLLDLMLPGLSGEELLALIRQMDASLPVIILTAKDELDEKINLLVAGADDYITKPFEIKEVVARVAVQLRHAVADVPSKLGQAGENQTKAENETGQGDTANTYIAGPVKSEILLQTKALTKQYGHQKAVDNVDIHIKKGAIYGFIGRNGAGKTTCMRMIGGLAKPTSGEISMFGYSGKDLSKVRSRVGCLIEAPGVYPNMTAKENIEMKCRLFGISKKGYAEGILDRVGLLNVGKKKTKNFSLGMKQRLGIGMALVGEPDLLVLDEPINGLDPQGIAEVRDTIQNLCAQQDMTVFISSHILEELSKLATDYGIINNGALLQEITREELLSKCSEKITLTVDNPNKAVPVLDKMGFVHYMIVDKNHIDVYERLNDSAALNTALVTAGVSVAQLAVTGMELETYFLSITGGATNV